MTIFPGSAFKPSDADFVPKRREISAVTNDVTPTVTTTEDHGYIVGQKVRLIVPLSYGMHLNYVQANILTVPTTTTFTVDVDTSNLSAYNTPTFPPAYTPSHAVPITGVEDNVAR